MKFLKLLLLFILVRVAIPGYTTWVFKAHAAVLHKNGQVWQIRLLNRKMIVTPVQYTIIEEL